MHNNSAPLHKVQRPIVVTTVVHVPAPFLSQCVKVFKKSISWQPLVRKHSYWHHRYLVGLAFIPQHWTLGPMPRVGAWGQNLVHIWKIGFLRLSFLEVHILTTTSYLHHRYLVGLAFTTRLRTPICHVCLLTIKYVSTEQYLSISFLYILSIKIRYAVMRQLIFKNYIPSFEYSVNVSDLHCFVLHNKSIFKMKLHQWMVYSIITLDMHL